MTRDNADTEEDRRKRMEGRRRHEERFRKSLAYKEAQATPRNRHFSVVLDDDHVSDSALAKKLVKGLREAKKQDVGRVAVIHSIAGTLPERVQNELRSNGDCQKLMGAIESEDWALTIVRMREKGRR